MTLEQLKELQELSWEWAKYAGFDKKTGIETLRDLNKEIQEAWDSRNNTCFYSLKRLDEIFNCLGFKSTYKSVLLEKLDAELADIFLILARMVDSSQLEYVLRIERTMTADIKHLAKSLAELKSDNCTEYKLATILAFCNHKNIYLRKQCLLKLKYNYSRKEYKK